MMNYDDALIKVAERTQNNRKQNRQDTMQRRHQVTEIYGQEYTAQGDSNTPAIVYLPVSKDLVYHEVMELQIRISGFEMPVKGGETTNASLKLTNTRLEIGSTNIPPNNHSHSLSPNPHTHELNPNLHSHSLSAGIQTFPSTATEFRLEISGVDITDAIKLEYPSNWIDGNGVFPKSDDGLLHYNLLGILPHLQPWQQNVILSSGLKEIKIYGNGVFKATVAEFFKFSHRN